MTLLERWDQYRHIGQTFSTDEIRRAIAIAQAVDEWRPSPPHNDDIRQQVEANAKLMLMRRADELLSMDDQP